MRFFLFISILLVSGMISCEKTPGIILVPDDCVFVQDDDTQDGLIDDYERSLMNECKQSSYETKGEIVENLIGEWLLIGHGEGWISSNSQPCSHIIIMDDELTLNINNANLDSETTHSWEIEHVNGDFFRLVVEPETPIYIGFTNFCASYMYLDGTPSDGNMYLYQKL